MFDVLEDVGCLARHTMQEPANYVSFAMRSGRLQDYVGVWNEMN